MLRQKQRYILKRLGLNESVWCDLATQFEAQFKQAAGSEMVLKEYKRNRGLKRMHGINMAVGL